MGVLEQVIERLESIDHRLDTMSMEIEELTKGHVLNQEWYTRKEACQVKGVSLSFCEKHTHHLPAFGAAERISRGRWGFRREDVRTWLTKSYDQIEDEWSRRSSNEDEGATKGCRVVGFRSAN